MPGEVDPAVAAYMEKRRAEILSVIPQLEEALEKARRENKRGLIRRLTKLLVGDENRMTLKEFLPHQARVISEVLWVADQLMAHGEFRPLLERVGVHGDLTETERKALEGHVKALLQGQRGWTEDDWNSSGLGNAWAAIALVRRVLAGIYEDLRSSQVIEFIDYNADYTGLYEHSKLFKPIECFPPHIEEVIFVFRELVKDAKTIRAMEEIVEKELWAPEDIHEIIYAHIYNISCKYGCVSKEFRGALGSAAMRTLESYVEGLVDINDNNSIVLKLREDISHSIYDWLMDPMMSEVRVWGPSHVILCGAEG